MSGLRLKSFIASVSEDAPLIMDEMPGLPTYSKMVCSWSVVGGFSVISSSNSAREGGVWEEWSLAWSSVAVADALAEACFRRVATRVEAGELALWKRVTISLVLRWEKSIY